MRRSTDVVLGRCAIPVAVTVLLAIGGCVPSGHLPEQRAASPTFDPIAFFAGAAAGDGRLKIVTKRSQHVTVAGRGVATQDDGIVLNQEVRRGVAPPSHRTWRLRRVGPDHYAGTLSDATGPVTGEVTGNLLHLAFPMKGGLRVQQWMYLQPGGQVALNHMVVTKFGLPVASLDETIRRIPG